MFLEEQVSRFCLPCRGARLKIRQTVFPDSLLLDERIEIRQTLLGEATVTVVVLLLSASSTSSSVWA